MSAFVEGYEVPSYVEYQWFLGGAAISERSTESGMSTWHCDEGVYDYTVQAIASTGIQERTHRIHVTAPGEGPRMFCPY